MRDSQRASPQHHTSSLALGCHTCQHKSHTGWGSHPLFTWGRGGENSRVPFLSTVPTASFFPPFPVPYSEQGVQSLQAVLITRRVCPVAVSSEKLLVFGDLLMAKGGTDPVSINPGKGKPRRLGYLLQAVYIYIGGPRFTDS